MGSIPVWHDGRVLDLARIHEMLSFFPGAVAYVAAPDLVIAFANDDFRQFAGDQEVTGRPARAVFPAPVSSEMLSQVMLSGQPVQGHEVGFWLRRGDQIEPAFAEVVYQPVHDATGVIAGVLLFAADVTAQVRERHAQEALASQLTATQDRYRRLFDTLPEGVVYYAADGLILEANPAAAQILGLDRDAMLGQPMALPGRRLHEDGSPFRPEDFPVTRARRAGEIVPNEMMGCEDPQTGEVRWLLVTAVPDSLDDHGRPQRVYAIFRDVTEQRRTEAALRDSAELLGRLRDTNALAVVSSDGQQIFEANDAFLDLTGYTREDLAAGRIIRDQFIPAESAAADRDSWEQLQRTGACRPYEKEYVHRDGHRVPVLVAAAVTDLERRRWSGFALDLTARQRAEQEREERQARERAARAAAERARERVKFLLCAGELLTAAQDQHELLQRAAQLVVDSLADLCLVFLPADDGRLRATSIAHRGPGQAIMSADLRDYRLRMDGEQTILAAWRSGDSQVSDGLAARAAREITLPASLRDVITRLGTEHMLATPLMAGDRPLGVLALGRSAERSRFSTTDIAVVEELCRQMVIGLGYAETSARDHTVAETLQRSLLPDTLPKIAGLDLAVRYLPAADGVNVGGDWYDAFPLDGNRVGLAIGDVAGHNITAASIMGQVRTLLRAYAIDTADPAGVLQSTNRALAWLLPEALATVIYATLDLDTGSLSYASAGHPPPLLSYGPGHAEYLDNPVGTMLGVPGGGGFASVRLSLSPGAGLLLYTDGLIEDHRRDITEGLNALAATIRSASGLTAEKNCQTVQSVLLGGSARADDVCVLAARFNGWGPAPASG